MIAQRLLKKYGVRDKVTLIASGKLFSPDRIAVALSMGADIVQIARGLMIAVGCIGAQKCHSNASRSSGDSESLISFAYF